MRRPSFSGSGVHARPASGPGQWFALSPSFSASGTHAVPVTGSGGWNLPRVLWGTADRDTRKVQVETVEAWTDVGTP